MELVMERNLVCISGVRGYEEDGTSPRNLGETFSCDVDGKYTEITIPADAWDSENETVWLTQAQLAELYRVNVPAINKQIQNIFEDEELQEDSVISKMEITATDGKCYQTKHYNLEMLIALGYRIKSKVATRFRQWATQHLKELMTKGRTEIQPMTDEEIMSRALEIAHRTLALREERIKALEAERDEAIRTKTQYQSNLAAQMSGRVGGLTTALNRVKLENDRLKGDRLTKEDVYIIMNTQGVSFTLKTVKDVIRDTLNVISEYLDEPLPKIKIGEHTNGDGKVVDVSAYVYTRKTVRVFFEYVENNSLGWQARNRKFILSEWLNHHMTIPAV
jgi:hypothetical protein